MTRILTAEELRLIEPLKLAVLKQLAEEDHILFSQYFFKLRQAISFNVNWHHQYLADELEMIITGKTNNLLIMVAPGSSKTELAVINFMARGLAINPRARFLHLSYSDDLAVLNSSECRNIVSSAEYQALWPRKINVDAKAKKRWNIIYEGKPSGGVYATSIGGQVTGFRAGHMAPGFQGALICDDLLRPDDAFSPAKREQANRKLVSTIKSRKAAPNTPTIVIMQRVGEMDPAGYIMSGNVPGNWRCITIPALIDDAFVATLDPKYQAMIKPSPRDELGRFSYWPEKETLEELLELERGGKVDKTTGNPISKYVFHSQYQQKPTPLGGSLIKGADFKRHAVIPMLDHRIITADTAQKTAERNDYSVFQHWGLIKDGGIILLDVLRGKWEAGDLKRNARSFWIKCASMDTDYTKGKLRRMYVEDKASGTGLIQEVGKPTPEDAERGAPHIPVEPIERNRDKLTEWKDGIPHIEAGYVGILDNQPWNSDYINECESVTAEMSHAHDDQVDPTMDAIDLLLASKNNLADWQRLAAAM